MKIGIISDIHGNFGALEAVWQKAKFCDKILSCGDLTGYYPDDNKVINFFRDKKIDSILGNHDIYLLKGKLPEKEKNSIKAIPFKLIKKTITQKNLLYLKSLKKQKIIEINNLKIGLFHGSPSYPEKYIYPDGDFEEFKNCKLDFVFLGHTHYPMIKKIGRMTIANPGSVGQPRDKDKRASFAILDTFSQKVEIKRVYYDNIGFCQRIKKLGFDQRLIDILLK